MPAKRNRNRKAFVEGKKNTAAEKLHAIGDSLDLPASILPGYAGVELLGNRQAIINGVQGILVYAPQLIKLGTKGLIITFEGVDLEVKTFQGDEIMLAGEITDIHYTTA
ncbi:MAG: YabP/YqfC family sporulation protein [Oscillospiraceae bacterium]|jgi:sporulation protein YqfC|nr:YabP/YqfC family sporulation protein [Oscillospiraceae bacterium]